MQTKNKIYRVRFDELTEQSLERLAKATRRKKADAIRMAIQLSAELFANGASTDLASQVDSKA